MRKRGDDRDVLSYDWEDDCEEEKHADMEKETVRARWMVEV